MRSVIIPRRGISGAPEFRRRQNSLYNYNDDDKEYSDGKSINRNTMDVRQKNGETGGNGYILLVTAKGIY